MSKTAEGYLAFLNKKIHFSDEFGFDPVFMPDFLFDFQKAIVEWATRYWDRTQAVLLSAGIKESTPCQRTSARRPIQSRRMKLIFICSPFSGETERNIFYAKYGCRLAIIAGHAPFAPHLLYPQFLMDELPTDRESGIRCGLAFLSVCDEVWVGDKYGISPGMKREIKEAQRLGIPIRYFKSQKRAPEPAPEIEAQ